MANDQINLPSLVVILVLSGLIVRYLFFSSPPGNQQPRDSLSQMRQREAAVERIQQMFPQTDRRTILWDLQRNGGSIAATTEKILSGRMETVRTSLQPLITSPRGLRLLCASLILCAATDHLPAPTPTGLQRSVVVVAGWLPETDGKARATEPDPEVQPGRQG